MILSIGRAAARLGLRASALRYYDDIGLVPASRRHGRRVYGAEALRRLAFVRLLGRVDVGLEVARAVLESLYTMRDSAGVPDQTLEEMLKKFPSSSVRARRSDLVKLGHVEETGNMATTRSGSPCKTWRITKSGIELVESQGVSS